MISESADGSPSILTKGMTYVVSDEISTHRSATEKGVKLLIIDGPDSYRGEIPILLVGWFID